MSRHPTSHRRKPPEPHEPDARGQRLQKVLAAEGIGSRRQCEELILAGRVELDHRVVTELGTRVDPARQEIRVDGAPLRKRKRVHYILNKPPGVVCTSRDPSGRQRVVDLVPSNDRLFTVGRLDMSSEGLILVTNDGELANRLTHPRYEIKKTYQVEVAGRIEPDTIERLGRGIHLAEGFVRVAGLHVKRRNKRSTVMQMVLTEGRNREIRRMLARVGHKVLRLRRIALGPLRLGDLPLGAYRQLDVRELRALRHAASGEPPQRKRTSSKQPSPKRKTPRHSRKQRTKGADE